MPPATQPPAPARLRPVPALRYRRPDEALAQVTIAPPDHWDDEQVSSFAGRDPHNVVRLLAPVLAGDGDPGRSDEVADRLRRWLSEGVLAVDPYAAVYVYRCSFGGHALTGVVATLDLPESVRRVLPHESLIPAIVERQIRLLRTTGAQLEPVVAVHRATSAWHDLVEHVTSAPADVTTVTEDGVVHTVWACRDPTVIDALAAQAVDIRAMIADGHHRWAALQRAAADDGVHDALVMLVDVERGGLRLGPIHRVLPGLTWSQVQRTTVPVGRQLSGEQDVRTELTRDPESCVLTDGQHWMCVDPLPAPVVRTGPDRDERLPIDVAVRRWTVSRLHTEWVPRWGVDERDIEYVHDLSAARRLAARAGGVAVLLPPPSLPAVFAAADAGITLPRKATSFGPKPRIGLLMRLLR